MQKYLFSIKILTTLQVMEVRSVRTVIRVLFRVLLFIRPLSVTLLSPPLHVWPGQPNVSTLQTYAGKIPLSNATHRRDVIFQFSRKITLSAASLSSGCFMSVLRSRRSNLFSWIRHWCSTEYYLVMERACMRYPFAAMLCFINLQLFLVETCKSCRERAKASLAEVGDSIRPQWLLK